MKETAKFFASVQYSGNNIRKMQKRIKRSTSGVLAQFVIPAKAGIQYFFAPQWMPTFVGMTFFYSN